jgi:hypothetical protein
MKLGRTGKIGLIGVAGYAIGLIWMMLHNYLESRNDPPGWIVDRSLYQPPAWLAVAGFLLFAGSVLFWLGGRIARLIARWRLPSQARQP